MEVLRGLTIMSVKAGNDAVSLFNEPIEGSAYRMVYDRYGYLADIENVGTGALAEDQLVFVRKQGTYGRSDYRIKETFILYEPDQFNAEQRVEYADIYKDYFAGMGTASYQEFDEEINEVTAMDKYVDKKTNDGMFDSFVEEKYFDSII